jgi:hypothetical protein
MTDPIPSSGTQQRMVLDKVFSYMAVGREACYSSLTIARAISPGSNLTPSALRLRLRGRMLPLGQQTRS